MLGQEIMQLKIGVYEDYVAGNYAGMVEKLNLACGMNFKKLDENYTVQILSVLADTGVNREVLKSGIDLLRNEATGINLRESGSRRKRERVLVI